MKNFRILRYITVILVVAGLTACSDSATGPGNGNGNGNNNGTPPVLPQLSQEVLKVDLSYFTGSTTDMVAFAQENSHYQTAKTTAVYTGPMFNSAAAFVGFLALAKNKNAEFKDGKWIWTYDYGYQNASYAIKLTAAKNNNGSTSWALFFSISSPDLEVHDYKFMEGTTAADGKSGQWQINSMDPESKFKIGFTWEIVDENERELSYTIFDDNGDKVFSADYSMAGSAYLLNYAYEQAELSEIGWNTDTGEGYFKDSNGDMFCWNADRTNVPCN